MADKNDHRDRLTRLRDQLAAAIDIAEPNMLPQLAGQYRATLAEIAALPPEVIEQSKTDELRARRQARRQPA
jgi:hypothetical protein